MRQGRVTHDDTLSDSRREPRPGRWHQGRLIQAGVLLLVVAAASAATALPTDPDRPAAPRAAAPSPAPSPTPSPISASAAPPILSDAARLRLVLADGRGFYGDVQYAGKRTAAAVIRTCRQDGTGCDSALVITRDGWASATAHLLRDTSVYWLQPLPGGAFAYFGDDEEAPARLVTPAGDTVDLRDGPDPVELTADSVLVVVPDTIAERYGRTTTRVWVLDPAARTLRPLRNGPIGRVLSPVQVTDRGALVVTLAVRVGVLPARVAVLTSLDGGRTWARVLVQGQTRAASLPGPAIIGPHGRMALVFSSDGATISPLTELWTSADEGATWVRMQPTHKPRFEAGLAYTPDGTLLIVDDNYPHSRLWRTTPDGTDLEPAPDLPAAEYLSASRGVLIAQVPGGFTTSTDGRTWDRVQFPPPITG